ncbi:MAG: hypothetical protein DRP08_02835 [Candidatus Aenigmatarchaeota archaeon]|nr:MAG: hypothetical protein DRP08_02835 [Candidatus Aenigmarchaeota archaeon]
MGLGDLIEQTFKRVVDYIIELADDFAEVLKRGILMIIQHLEVEAKPDIDKLIPAEFLEMPYYKDLKKYVEENAGKKPVPLLALAGMVGGSIVGTGVGMGLGGFGRDISNWFNAWRRPTPLDINILAYAKHTGKLSDDVIDTNYASLGYNDNYKDVLFDFYKPKLTVTELLEAEKRIENLEIDINAELKRHGFNDKEINILRELSYAYPSPTDFIRFAVRDVFTKDAKTQEALSAEFPEDIVEYAEKAGMRRDVLMWYWMSHWELPSPTQVFEMLHRLHPDVLKVRGKAYREMGLKEENLKTDLDTVKFYLKQADYDKRWRERLLAISYNPLTRVDLRRIYELGLIDDNELLARLMEVGYTKKDAELMLEFYKTFRQEEARTFAKTEIKYLLYYGLINETEAKIMLERLGYTEEDAKTMIELWKVKLAEKDMRETQKFVRDAYALGEITRAEAERMLRDVGLSEETINVVLDKEDARRLSSVKLPSASTVVKWLKQGIITKEEARKILEEINVKKDYIPYYIAEGEVG